MNARFLLSSTLSVAAALLVAWPSPAIEAQAQAPNQKLRAKPVASAPAPSADPTEARQQAQTVLAEVQKRAQAIRRARPDFAQSVDALRPARTRGGSLRFVHPQLINDPDTALMLTARLAQNPAAELRAALADALARNPSPDVSRILWAQLQLEAAPQVRSVLAFVLWRSSDAWARDGLRKAASDHDPKVRLNALMATEQHPQRAMLIDVIRLGLADLAAPVQIAALNAVGTLGDRALLQDLEAFLQSRNPKFRLHALRAAQRIDRQGAQTLAIRYRLQKDSDPKVARVAKNLTTK